MFAAPHFFVSHVGEQLLPEAETSAATFPAQSRSWVAFGLLLGLLSLGLVTIWFRYGWLTRGLHMPALVDRTGKEPGKTTYNYFLK